jgi:nucleoside-diphosphate-sugar epimerase
VKHAFVTGSSGFVGAHLVYMLLEKGYTVSALIRSHKNLSAFNALSGLYPGANPGSVSWIEGDLLSPENWIDYICQADVVFHAAAVVSFSPKDKGKMMETNIQGTAFVVNACLKNNRKPLIYVSSVAALGRAEGQTEVTEKTIWKDTDHNTHYAISKHLAEQEVWRGIEEGLPAAIVCPGIIVGPWKRNTGSGQIPALVKKRLPFYPKGENGFVDVRDVAGMMIALFEQSCYGHRLLCVAENTSYKRVLCLFANGFGVSPPTIALKGTLLTVLFWVSRLFESLKIYFPFPYQGLKSTSLKTHYFSVNDSMLRHHNYRPLETTIKETVAFY